MTTKEELLYTQKDLANCQHELFKACMIIKRAGEFMQGIDFVFRNIDNLLQDYGLKLKDGRLYLDITKDDTSKEEL